MVNLLEYQFISMMRLTWSASTGSAWETTSPHLFVTLSDRPSSLLLRRAPWILSGLRRASCVGGSLMIASISALSCLIKILTI
ncbi:hypothetical protein CYMTET_24857, partial [Cymbomonas tetramitiformis]